MKNAPPRNALKFLRWFCREDYLEELEGDLTEVYEKQYEASPGRASLAFTIGVFRYLRPGFIKSFTRYKSVFMYRNYFKISWRNLLRQKMYSIIKIGGLAIGIAACCLIGLYLRNELSYDKHYPDNIYRVLAVIKDNGGLEKGVSFPAPMAGVLKNDYPEVIIAGRYNDSELFGAGKALVRTENNAENNYEEKLVYMDQTLLQLLKLPMVYGSATHALAEPNSVVITASVAERYFPKQDPTGKLLIINNNPQPFKIGGVVEDFPATSHINFNFMVTMTGKEFWPGEQNSWGAVNYATYIEIRPGTDLQGLTEKMTKGVIEKYYLPALLAENNMSEAQLREMFSRATLELQPLQDIYLKTDFRDGLPHNDMRYIWIFGAIAIIILVIACINFVNLSTAKSANRAKEVGLRKVMGSFRSNIISQFMTESLLFTIISFSIGIILAALFLPFFNQLAARSIQFPWTNIELLPWVLTALILIALLAGVYPSFYLSSFRPANVLKGNLSLGSKNPATRSVLVVFQFVTSIVLIVSTVVIYRQMEYIMNKKLGYDKEKVLIIDGAGTLGQQLPAFKNSLLNLPQVKYVTASDFLPVANTSRNGNSFWVEGKVKDTQGLGGQFWSVDPDYIKTMGIKIVDGRDFDVKMATDSQAVVINRRMVKLLNLTEPVGSRITNGREVFNVIGVVDDFHFESMKVNIEPLCIALGKFYNIMSVKASSNDLSSTIEAIATTWKKFVPQQPFRYTFLDQRFAMMHDEVKRMGSIFTCFAVFAIFVACLGLFGLSSFMVEQRSREISIRLVLGATLNNIFGLLTRNFVILVAIAFLIAAPVAWYAMQRWLEDYTYRTEITWDIFAIAGAVSFVIALLTVSVQSIRAALTKPITGLRSE